MTVARAARRRHKCGPAMNAKIQVLPEPVVTERAAYTREAVMEWIDSLPDEPVIDQDFDFGA